MYFVYAIASFYLIVNKMLNLVVTGIGFRSSARNGCIAMKGKTICAFLLWAFFGFSALAEDGHQRPKFSNYPAPLYTGRLLIPSYYVKYGGAWRDDMGKEVAPPAINFSGKYHVGLHSCGAECRYYTLSDLSTGSDSKALDMFSSDGEKPTRTRDGRSYITNLVTRPTSAMIVAQYHIDASGDHSAECRERVFLFSQNDDVIKPITATTNGCGNH